MSDIEPGRHKWRPYGKYSEYVPQVLHPVIALSPDMLQNHSGKEAMMKNRKYPRLKHHD
ncbi:hypothetical protein [Pantoea agglomerans]